MIKAVYIRVSLTTIGCHLVVGTGANFPLTIELNNLAASAAEILHTHSPFVEATEQNGDCAVCFDFLSRRRNVWP